MTIHYDIPPNIAPIDEIYIALSCDKNGEGIVSGITSLGATPFVFGDKKILQLVKPMIMKIAKETGKTIKIFKFKKFELLEEIKGGY